MLMYASDYSISCNWSFGQEYPCRKEIVRRQLSSICVSTFTNVLALHFKVKFDQLFFIASSTVTIDFKLADIKLESFEAHLPKL